MTEFNYLFSPIKVGSVTAKNRICCSAHADALSDKGMPGERQRLYYEEKARGGTGFMMCMGVSSVHPSSITNDWNNVRLYDDKVIPYLQRFSEAIHKYDCPVICQMSYRGRRSRSDLVWNRVYAPSDIREPDHREYPHPIDDEMMDEIIESFADAAERVQKGGFDGCEIQASHCHLIDQFWTANANVRTDQYGGSTENRMRFGVRVIEAVRERVGSDFLVGIRVTGDDFQEKGLNHDKILEICSRLNDLKMLDYFNVIGGTAESYTGIGQAIPNMSFKLGLYTYLSASIRSVVDVPVIATGRIVDPIQADKILAAGQADLVIMNRSLMADPHMPNKAKAGMVTDIRQCMGYNQGCIDRIYYGVGVTCVQNPVISREAEWRDLNPAEIKKKVVVVGGGPAGLEAARVAAERGHQVVLFEKSDQLGGQTLIAKLATSRQDFDGATRWSSMQCQKLGVDLRLNTSADVEMILAESPDFVIIATGANARRPDLEGLDEHQVFSAWDVLQGTANGLGDVILVIDEEYGYQGLSTAEFLLDRGKEVDLITSQERVADFLGHTNRPPPMRRVFKKGLQTFNHLEAEAIRDGHLVARNIWTGDRQQVGPYDSFVYAYGGIRVDTLSEPLKEKGFTVEAVGDAFSPRTLQHAILEGHKYARGI